MNNVMQNSLFIGWFKKIYVYFKKIYKESFIYYIFSIIVNKIKQLSEHSYIWNYITNNNKIEVLWSNSFIIKIINVIINIPVFIIRKIYMLTRRFLDSSFTNVFFKWMINNITNFISILIIGSMIIPAEKWHNIYLIIGIAFIFGVYLLKSAGNKEYDLSFNNIDPSIVFISIVTIFSFLFSMFIKESLNDMVSFIFIILITLIIVNNSNKKDLYKIINALMIGAVLTGLYGLYQWKIVGVQVNPSLVDLSINQGMLGRVFSTMGNANVYGELLIIIIPFFIAYILSNKNLNHKVLGIIGLIILLINLFKTGSRSSWIALIFSIVIFIILKNIKALPSLLLAVIVAMPFIPKSILNRFLTVFNPADTSITYRAKIVSSAKPMLKNYWLSGVGLGSNVFSIAFEKYKNANVTNAAHTHNLFIQLWIESGILMFLSFIWMTFRMTKKTLYIINNTNDTKLTNIAIAALSALLGLILMGMADHILFYKRIVFYFWIIISIILLVYKIVNKDKQKEETL